MLKEGVSNHCHEGVTVKALPGASLEMVEAEFADIKLRNALSSWRKD
jgi:hypothetical protein